jgi:HEPN domain-containing protein
MSGNDRDIDAERQREADRWLAVAAADIRTVRLCLDADEPMLGIAAYHCQQAAEKVVKGMLVIAGIPFATTHDMTRLGDLAASRYAEFQPLLAELGLLTVWGYAYRYPSLEDALEPEPPPEVLVPALQTIDRLADHLRLLIATDKNA